MSSFINNSGGSANTSTVGDIILSLENNKDGYLLCDGSEVDYNYPSIWSKLCYVGNLEVDETLSSTSTSYAIQNPFHRYVNGLYITFRYYYLRYKSPDSSSWSNVDMTSYRMGNYSYGFVPRDCDYYDGYWMFLIMGRNSKGSDTQTTKVIITQDGTTFTDTGMVVSRSIGAEPYALEKVGDYWIIKFGGAYGYNDNFALSYSTNPVDNSWTHIIYNQGSTSGKHTGVAYVTRDVIYVNGKYITCGFYTNPDNSKLTPCVAYHTDLVGNLSDFTRIFLGDGEDSSSYAYNQSTCIRLGFLPNSSCYVVQVNKGSVTGTTYTTSVWYSYNLSQGFTMSTTSVLLCASGTQDNVYRKLNHDGQYLYTETGYAIPDVEGYTGDPFLNAKYTGISATTNYFSGPDDEYGMRYSKTGTNDIYYAKKYLPNISVDSNVNAFIKYE